MKMLIPALALLSTTAMAADYKINVDGKVDYVNASTKTTVRASGVTTEAKSASFIDSTIRFNMLAKVNDDLSLRMRYRVNKEGADVARDTATSALDFFFVDHNNSFFTTRFGKQSWTEAFGRESMVNGNDLALTSEVYAKFNAVTGHYRTGVSAIKKMEGIGAFTLALSNPNGAVTDTTLTTKNSTPAYGAYYNGSFMDKMIQPVVGYTVAPQDGDTDHATLPTKKANNTLMAFGLRSEVVGLVLDVDYKEYKKADNNSGSNTTAGNKETKTKSMYANAAYAIDAFTPYVSYMNDKHTDVGTATNDFKKTSMAFGSSYKPYADVGFRYDLRYLTAKKEYTTHTTSEVKDSKISFGIVADI